MNKDARSQSIISQSLNENISNYSGLFLESLLRTLYAMLTRGERDIPQTLFVSAVCIPFFSEQLFCPGSWSVPKPRDASASDILDMHISPSVAQGFDEMGRVESS
jgi:hypothetical protein